jgi:serine acetyltransferase
MDRLLLLLLFMAWVVQVLAVDIHPAARLGKGIFLLDHAAGVVVGETVMQGIYGVSLRAESLHLVSLPCFCCC